MQPELLDQLRKHPVSNLPVIGFFENYPLDDVVKYHESMILTGTSDYPWAYLSVPNHNDLEGLLEKFAYTSLYFANVEEWMIPQLTRKRRIEWKLLTNRYYLPEDTEVKPTEQSWAPLDQSHVGYVFQNSAYKDYTSELYISERLARDISAGIWVNDVLAAWGLTHDDGSLGFLNVISEYRGQGLGEAVFRTLINAKQAAGKPVFVNVEPQNKQSINLLEKLGLVFDRPVSWIKLA
ncbi:MAG: GNAT family N-acetyltransferase [Bacteroidota bacterium]